MTYRIEVGFKKGFKDARGEKIKKKIRQHLQIEVESVRIVDVYTIDGDFSEKQIVEFGEKLFVDHIVQEFSVNKTKFLDFDWSIEVGFKPGVTDNVGRTARESIECFCNRSFLPEEGVYTSTLYLINGELDREDAKRIAEELLANTLIHRYEIISRKDFGSSDGFKVFIPKVREKVEPKVERISLKLPDKQLLQLSKDRLLALNIEELNAIRDYIEEKKDERRIYGLDDRITDIELECIAQTWSEHCKHKIFNALITYVDENGKTQIIDSLFKTYIKGSTQRIRQAKKENDICVSVFTDNAGVIKFNKDWNLVFKVETHNTPSALDPYGGAITGIVGVNRDPFGTGKGAKLIFNTDVFCFASPFYSKELPPRILHPRRIFEGVREGVEHGGNKSGIPTINGCIVFDDRYLGKPLVYCGTGGIMPSRIKGEPSHKKKANPGDYVVMVGGRIGKDGIHGATFSSEKLHEESPTSAVQIGDPITQKRMTDFLLKARDLGLYTSITDNGAGGLSCSVGEMAQESGGAEVWLEKAPLKYEGLHPWEILLSEAQERMTLAVSLKHIERFLNLAKEMGVEATVIGKFTNTGKFHIKFNDKTCGLLDLNFLHHGVPKMKLQARWEKKVFPEPDFKEPEDLTYELLEILSRLNVCSKEYVIRQYDHEVQGGSVVKPLVGKDCDGPSDAACIRPLLHSYEGVVISCGICPKYGDIDTYHMTACAIDEAIRNNIAVGGNLKHMALLDNFCWPDPIKQQNNPDGDFKLAQLVRANQALYDYTTVFETPCISGKDSMKNDYQIGSIKISVPPTILFSCISKIEDIRKAITMDAKKPGDLVYVVGDTYPEMGGSEYYIKHGYIGNNVPKVNGKKAKKIYEQISFAIDQGLIASCHDCSDGGLGIALAEVAFAGGLGMSAHLAPLAESANIKRNDFLLFSESQSRFIVTISKEDKSSFEEIMDEMPCYLIGEVRMDSKFLLYGLDDRKIVDTDIKDLKEAWQKTLRW